jgi:hypothetical protein
VSQLTLARGAAVRERIALIRAEPPVIYVVSLAGLQRMTFSKTTLAVHVYSEVLPETLVAKMIIDQPVDYAKIDVKGHNQALRTVLYSAGNHYIKQIAA